MTKTRGEWRFIRRRYADGLRDKGIKLVVRDHVWAQTEDDLWVALPGATATTNPDQWWLGYDREEFHRRDALGAILLCNQVDGQLLDFGLPGEVIRTIEPDLPIGSQRPQLYFNVFRRSGNRFELQLRGARAFDITDRRGELSWLRRHPNRNDASAVESMVVMERPADATEHRFFARATSGGLKPLDHVELTRDTIYLVHARSVEVVPSSGALRRIVARGGPADLPPDFAEQHDHYAHGTPKR